MTLETEVQQVGRLRNRCVPGQPCVSHRYDKLEAAANEPI
jgi:hypothetical protein